MKKLGRFTVEICAKYRELLAHNGIKADVRDIPNFVSHFTSLGTYQVPIFVKEDNFEKALQIIRNHEIQSQPRVDEIDSQLRSDFIRIVVTALVLIFILIYFFNK